MEKNKFQKYPKGPVKSGIVSRKEVKLPLELHSTGPRQRSKVNSKWMFQALKPGPSPPLVNPEIIPCVHEPSEGQSHPFLINMKPSTARERGRAPSRRMVCHSPSQSPVSLSSNDGMGIPSPRARIQIPSRDDGWYHPWEAPSPVEVGEDEDFI